MLKMLVTLQMLFTDRFERDDEGATAVEYGLLVALIAAVIVVTVGLLGVQIKAAFQTVLTAITPAG